MQQLLCCICCISTYFLNLFYAIDVVWKGKNLQNPIIFSCFVFLAAEKAEKDYTVRDFIHYPSVSTCRKRTRVVPFFILLFQMKMEFNLQFALYTSLRAIQDEDLFVLSLVHMYCKAALAQECFSLKSRRGKEGKPGRHPGMVICTGP